MRSGEVLFVCVHVCEHPIVRCVHLEPLPQLVQAPSSPAVGLVSTAGNVAISNSSWAQVHPKAISEGQNG